jgi:hypothetical protein
VKQEFKQNLEKADGEQFEKFLRGWEQYYDTIKVIPDKDIKSAKRVLSQNSDSYESKLSDEQKESLTELKSFIYNKK